jgi:hypothetical protein
MSDINVKGLSELQALLNQLPEKLEKNVLRGGLRAGANVIKPLAQANVHSISGELAKGLKISTKAQGGRVTATLKSTGKHAFIGHMLEFTGAAPHIILPKIKEALEIGGNVVMAVHHPGFHAKPWMRPALDAGASDAVVAVGNYVKNRLATREGLDTADIEIEAQ